MNRKTIIFLAALAILGATIIMPKSTYAFWPFDVFKKATEPVSQRRSIFPPIIQKIIDKFGLNSDEVKEVVDEAREEKHQQMQARLEEKLVQAVKNGKITEEQKNRILAKHEEMRQRKEKWQSLTPVEKREKMHELKEEMRQWAKQEGINLKDILGFGMRFGRGRRGFACGLGK